MDDPDEAEAELSVEVALVEVDDPDEAVVGLSVEAETALVDADDPNEAVVELPVETGAELELGPTDTSLAPQTPL